MYLTQGVQHYHKLDLWTKFQNFIYSELLLDLLPIAALSFCFGVLFSKEGIDPILLVPIIEPSGGRQHRLRPLVESETQK